MIFKLRRLLRQNGVLPVFLINTGALARWFGHAVRLSRFNGFFLNTRCRQIEAVETAAIRHDAACTLLKQGVNEKLCGKYRGAVPPETHRAIFWGALCLFSCANLFAQQPFQFPTANHALYETGNELKFFAPTAPDKPWTTGSFGCVRSDGRQMHEGLDIRCLQRGRHGEPADPVMATADGTVVYFSTRPALSNYGKYVVIRHIIDGIEIYSLYAHLSEIQPGLAVGKPVKAGEVIATMGRTSNTSETITKDRAHVHFELNVFVNEGFASWYKQTFPNQRNDHGIWNGQNLNGIDVREILLAEHNPVAKFSLLNFVRSQTELCRVFVRSTSFPYLKRYAALVLPN